MFKHDFVNLPAIHNEDTPNGRFYVTPTGERYQSVTTFLGKFSDHSWLDAWKERVGEEEVSKRSTQAKRRGTAVHSIVEQIVLNTPPLKYRRGQMPNNLIMAGSIADVLRARAGIIKGLEVGLWSHRMKIAGRTDCLGEFDGEMSIIDFKTSKWPKKAEDIEGYFLQTTIYALMVEEITDIVVPNIAVIIGVDDEPAQVFVRPKNLFVNQIEEMVSKSAS